MKGLNCKDCKNRYVTEHSNCHATCKDYLEWRENRLKELDRLQKEKDINNALTGMAMNWGLRR